MKTILLMVIALTPLSSLSNDLFNSEPPVTLESELGYSTIESTYCLYEIEALSKNRGSILKWRFEPDVILDKEKNVNLSIVKLSEALLSSFNEKASIALGLNENLTHLLDDKIKNKNIIIGVDSIVNNKHYTSITRIDKNNELITRIVEGKLNPKVLLPTD